MNRPFLLYLTAHLICFEGAIADEQASQSDNSQPLTCRRLLVQINQNQTSSVGTLLRLLNYGLNTPNGMGGKLLSPAELSEMLRSEKLVNPKRFPKSSVERSYHVALEAALKGVAHISWASIKEEIAKLIGVKAQSARVVEEGVSTTESFYRLKEIKRAALGTTDRFRSAYKVTTSGDVYYALSSRHTLYYFRMNSNGSLDDESMRSIEISEDPNLHDLAPSFYTHSDGSVSVVHNSSGDIRFFPLFEGRLQSEDVIEETFLYLEKKRKKQQMRLKGHGPIQTPMSIGGTFDLTPQFVSNADGSVTVLSTKYGTYLETLSTSRPFASADDKKWGINNWRDYKKFSDDTKARKQNTFTSDMIIHRSVFGDYNLFVPSGTLFSDDSVQGLNSSLIYSYHSRAKTLSLAGELPVYSNSVPAFFDNGGTSWFVGVSERAESEKSYVYVWRVDEGAILVAPAYDARFSTQVSASMAKVKTQEYSNESELIAIYGKNKKDKSMSTLELWQFNSRNLNSELVFSHAVSKTHYVNEVKFVKLQSGEILMALQESEKSINIYLIDKDNPKDVRQVLSVPAADADLSFDILQFDNGKLILTLVQKGELTIYDIYGADR